MERFNELQSLVNACEKDFQKFYIKGNKEAGIRLRKQMQALRSLAKTIRNEVQEQKNPRITVNNNTDN